MRILFQLTAVAGAILLNGCCSNCLFWEAVEKGYYIQPEREEKLQTVLDRTMPQHVKTLARVLIRRGNRERVFSMLAKADRKKRELVVAGMTDLGSVMFRAQWAENKGARILVNRSGWDDRMIQDVIIRDCLSVFLPDVNPMNIIEDHEDRTVTLRSRNKDKSLDRFVFDNGGNRWKCFERKTSAYMGQVSYRYVLTLGDWRAVSGHSSKSPYLIEITDEQHRYTASIELRRITTLNP